MLGVRKAIWCSLLLGICGSCERALPAGGERTYVWRDSTISHKAYLKRHGQQHYQLCVESRQGDSLLLFSGWHLRYPTYRFGWGDMDGDGSPDLAVGVVKPTRFFPEPAKRVFLFKVYKGHVRPLWLGSRVSARPLVDFRVQPGHPATLRTLEQEKEEGRFLVAEYAWRGFGMGFVRYVGRDMPWEQARIYFDKQKNGDV